ncbi:GGDEF domain-containing protein [Kosmotoga pacifica]|uniref:GGDEF domain-containing protein n=1 Tax=Kosmotoga pacifica TaxID=1330330 RepID=UPI00069BE4E3|nr:sensor domain-containing diguanylate cyclase [Kosmotoga pacifica]
MKKIYFINIILIAISALLALGLINMVEEFTFSVRILPLLVFFVLTDLVPIKTKQLRLITNFAGMVPLLIFWNPYLAPFAAFLTAIKKGSYSEHKTQRKLFRVLHNFIMYASGVYFTSWDGNPYLSLLYFTSIAKLSSIVTGDILNQYVNGRKLAFENLLVNLIEASYFFFLAIIGGMLWSLHLAGMAFEAGLTFMLFPLTLMVVWIIAGFLRANEEAKNSLSRLRSIRSKLAKTLELISIVRSESDIEKTLTDVANIIRESIGYKYVIINLFDDANNAILRIAQAGIPEEEFKKMRENPPPLEYFDQVRDEKYRVSRSYFMPESSKLLDTTYSFMGHYDELLEAQAEWRPDDILVIPIYKGENIVGYISVDAPFDGRRPQYEDIEILEIVADQVLRIIEESERFREILMASKLDHATGLYTHTEFYSILESVIKANRPFSLIMIDLDNFKEINDNFGHIVGDRAIQEVAEVIKSSLRKGDFAARYGGDEFAIIVAEASKSNTIQIARRMNDKLKKLRLKEKDRKIEISWSMGIANFPIDGETPSEIVEKADNALYAAKRSGKNRIYAI